MKRNWKHCRGLDSIPKGPCVYFMRAKWMGVVCWKFGYTKNLRQRMRSLSATRLICFATFRTIAQAKREEKRILGLCRWRRHDRTSEFMLHPVNDYWVGR